jgi:hypothetical protein
MGESCEFKRGLGLDARADLAVLSPGQEGSPGQNSGGAPGSRSGLIIGDFVILDHEGRGAGKTAPRGGHRLVSRKRIVSEKEKITENKKLRDKIVTEKGMYALSES